MDANQNLNRKLSHKLVGEVRRLLWKADKLYAGGPLQDDARLAVLKQARDMLNDATSAQGKQTAGGDLNEGRV